MSVDPLIREYPWYTPYQFAGNRPIDAIDLDGLEEYLIIIYPKNSGNQNQIKLLKADGPKLITIQYIGSSETETFDWDDAYLPKTTNFITQQTEIIDGELRMSSYKHVITPGGWEPYSELEERDAPPKESDPPAS